VPTPFGKGPLEGQIYVAYLDLSGGRNTKKDPHALDRNQLAVSDNTWMAQGNTIARRPGSISIPGISAGLFSAISAGSTGSGVGATGMVEGRFFDTTTLVVQGSNNQLYGVPLALPAASVGVNSWVSIGAISTGGVIQAAQLYDPLSSPSPDGTLFITDGIDTPKLWQGPGFVISPVPTINLPLKNNINAPITPKYCATLFSSLFYAGEPTDPSMVYISNPFNPQLFTTNILVPTNTITQSTYIGAPVGRGDGVNGGNITGLVPMGGGMIVYKESSIYALTQLGILGDMSWGASVMSSSVGCVSPRSLVAFDTFHVFLGIDGVYVFNGQGTIKVSSNNPDLFDGPTAQILNRQTAIGVRFGNRYLIFFDNGSGFATSPSVGGSPLGYACVGAWFDFDKVDADGLPAVGTLSNMNVGGIAPLRGAMDLGNFAWADAKQDRVAYFNATVNGAPVYADFGNVYTVTVQGKADFMADVWEDEGPEDVKQVDSVHLLMSFPIIMNNQTYAFTTLLTYDQFNTLQAIANVTLPQTISSAIVGTAVVGTAVLGLSANTPVYNHVYVPQPDPSEGTIVQVQFQESSANPWTCLGYLVLANRQRRVGHNSG
jgi:hypothetical protein